MGHVYRALVALSLEFDPDDEGSEAPSAAEVKKTLGKILEYSSAREAIEEGMSSSLIGLAGVLVGFDVRSVSREPDVH